MSRYRKIINTVFASTFFIALILSSNTILAADGEALFKANCANCHKPDADYTGPALKGARDREPNKDWAYKWLANNNVNTMLETDPYAKTLLAKWGSRMTAQNLSKEDAKAILDWADAYVPIIKKDDPNKHQQKTILYYSVFSH